MHYITQQPARQTGRQQRIAQPPAVVSPAQASPGTPFISHARTHHRYTHTSQLLCIYENEKRIETVSVGVNTIYTRYAPPPQRSILAEATAAAEFNHNQQPAAHIHHSITRPQPSSQQQLAPADSWGGGILVELPLEERLRHLHGPRRAADFHVPLRRPGGRLLSLCMYTA